MGPWPGAFPQLGFVCVCFVSFFVTHGSYLGMLVLISLGGGHPLAVPGTGEQVFSLVLFLSWGLSWLAFWLACLLPMQLGAHSQGL